MKIIVLDAYAENPGDLSWSDLGTLGDITVYERTPLQDTAEILKRIGDAEIVFTNKTPLTRQVLMQCRSIRFVGVLATGYNIVDCNAAKEIGIVVCNAPAYSTNSVGQFAIALLLEICHHIGHHDIAVHDGRWENSSDFCFWDYPLIELAGKTMGIIGFGQIGQRTGRIAKALGMKVIASGSRPNDTGREIAEYVSLDELLARSDVISLHCPLIPETKGIINRQNIAKTKDGVIIINNSRGPLIVEQDLADALNSGKVYAAGMDVVSVEPICGDNPLLKAKNCLITPHISWASKESRQRLMEISVENLRQFLKCTPVNVVNL